MTVCSDEPIAVSMASAPSRALSGLRDAYEAALYEVDVSGVRSVIRIGQPLPDAINAQLRAHGVSTAAFLSAANPLGRRCDEQLNVQRHAALLDALGELKAICLPAWGRDASGQWPAEQSVLALRLGPGSALRLAQRFAQNAYVEVTSGRSAQLVFTEHWRTISMC